MKIIIKERTPSSNMVYWQKGYHKFIKKEYKELRERIRAVVKKKIGNRNLDMEDYIDKKLSVTILVYENWLTKAGEITKRDLANKQKFLLDSIFMELDIDDKFIWELNMVKIQSNPEEKTIVDIKPFRI